MYKTIPKHSTSPSCCQYRMQAEDGLRKRKAVSKIRTLKTRRYLGNRQGPSDTELLPSWRSMKGMMGEGDGSQAFLK